MQVQHPRQLSSGLSSVVGRSKNDTTAFVVDLLDFLGENEYYDGVAPIAQTCVGSLKLLLNAPKSDLDHFAKALEGVSHYDLAMPWESIV